MANGRWHGGRGATVWVMLGLALTACSSSKAAEPTASPTTGPGPTATTGRSTSDGPVVATTGGTAAAGGDGATVPVGGTLPSDDECAQRVVRAPEVRRGNTPYNQRAGTQKSIPEPYLERVTGAFTGTTDEILQWGACKWGIDPDIARAQAAKESFWKMDAAGDFASDAAVCPPGHAIGADGKPGQCPESIGILQVRYQYHGPPAKRPTWPEAADSTAYNVDYTYAIWRSCFEGDLTWLNTTDRGAEYAAGDAWGCVGVWFAGRWRTPPAEEYIAAVRANRDDRIWETKSFESAG